MTHQHLLPLSLNEVIEDKFGQHILYNYLSFVCKPIAAESNHFAFKPSELFYHCVFSLDSMKGLQPMQLKSECTLLWPGLVDYMRDHSLSTTDAEVIHAISLITYSVVRCLMLADNPIYTYPEGILQSFIQKYDSAFANQLRLGFNRAEQLTNMVALSEWVTYYMDSQEFLSDDIEKLIDTFNTSHPQEQEKPTQKELKETFTYIFMKTEGYTQLIEFLLAERNREDKNADADWARHALVIYEQQPTILKKRPNTFKEWLHTFCKLFGREWKRDYEPGKLRNREFEAEKFMPPKTIH